MIMFALPLTFLLLLLISIHHNSQPKYKIWVTPMLLSQQSMQIMFQGHSQDYFPKILLKNKFNFKGSSNFSHDQVPLSFWFSVENLRFGHSRKISRIVAIRIIHFWSDLTFKESLWGRSIKITPLGMKLVMWVARNLASANMLMAYILCHYTIY